MSKGLGQKIGIRFTDEIVSLTETPVDGYPTIETQEGTWSATGTYSSYSVDNIKDGNTSTYWQTRSAGAYIQIELGTPIAFTGFKYYRTTSYYTMSYTLKGSHDGITFEDVYKGSSSPGTGYLTTTFKNTVSYKYYRLVIDSLSSRLYLYELSFIYKMYKNEIALSVSGLECQYVNGPLRARNYDIARVDRYPDDLTAVLLTLEEFENRFNNTQGELTIRYEAPLGDLMGRGGGVESFEVAFTPEDLVPKPNPHQAENITATATVAVVFTGVSYTKAHNMENISVQAAVSAALTYVGVINP